MTIRNQTGFDNLPLVSIIMPCRNASGTISQAIDSVINQDYRNVELIIIDDDSTDASVEIVGEYCSKDSRVVFVRNNGKHGVARARNAGLAVAKGRFIAFLDADDYLTEDSIRRRVQYCIDNNAKIVFGPYNRLLPNGIEMLVSPPSVISFFDMLKRNHIGNLTGLYDADFFGVVMQHNIRHEDYLMWCCLLRKANFAFSVLGFPLGVYRVSASSLSGNKIQSARWHWHVLRHGLGIGLLASIYYQMCYVLSSVFDRAIALWRISK